MKEIYFITGNELKFSIALDILKDYGIKVIQKNLETPEIQSFEGKEICEFSAKFAANKLNLPVIKTDVSYHIKGLNGFPGPFIKFINKWLDANDLLIIMKDKDREVEIKEFLSFVSPGKEQVTFDSVSRGKIAEKIINDKGTTIDKLLIREGFDIPQNAMSKESLNEMFKKEVKIYHKLGEFLKYGKK